MRKVIFFVLLIVSGFLTANCQKKNDIKTKEFADDFKKLIQLNSFMENLINLSGKEYINISANATASQIIEITKPYLQASIINARSVCLAVLNIALLEKAESEKRKQEIVEILCRNYLDNEGIQRATTLLMMKEKDFNLNAKKYVAALVDSLPKFSHSICFKLLALAQIKSSIAVLWKVVDSNVATMGRTDLDILASLARMNEKKAGILLCNYYNSIKNRSDYKQVFVARNLAFSLDKDVLNCMVDDYKTIDIKKFFRDGDTGYHPSQALGGGIASMLKNYPYIKGEYQLDPKQLLDWLNQSGQYDLDEK